MGAPGFAHGGAVATALDDAFGSLLRLLNRPAVTVHLEIDYRKPWLIDTPHRIEARIEREEERKLHMKGRALDAEGNVVAEATSIFLIVGLEHFMEGVEHAREMSRGESELPLVARRFKTPATGAIISFRDVGRVPETRWLGPLGHHLHRRLRHPGAGRRDGGCGIDAKGRRLGRR